MKLTEEQIIEINRKQETSEQGIYNQPYKIPNNVKGLVLYQRYVTGGYSGGNCWGDESRRFTNDEIPEFTILEDVLEVLKPDIKLSEYREIKKHIKTTGYSADQYYGNSDNYEIKYLELDELYNLLNIK
jgi:hypothetical protein